MGLVMVGGVREGPARRSLVSQDMSQTTLEEGNAKGHFWTDSDPEAKDNRGARLQ